MSLRTTKITRDVFNSYKQLATHKSDIASISYNRSQTRNTAQNESTHDAEDEDNINSNAIRYIVANTNRPKILPEIQFNKNPEQLIPPEMRHLQPAMLPKFLEIREESESTRWELSQKENISNTTNCPFPEPIKEQQTDTMIVSDQKKAELKMPNPIRMGVGNINTFNRSFCTTPYLIPFRSMASGQGKKAKKDDKKYKNREHCDDDTPKIVCDISKKRGSGCPRFVLHDCPQSTGSNCRHKFVDPKCKKKNAPYPSYSESCAERLEEDPSECMQCPWQKCGGVEAIKSQKRKFHQMASTRINPFNPPTMTPLYSPGILDLDYGCDASKKPCKPPIGKCEQEGKIRNEDALKKWKRKIEDSRRTKTDKSDTKFSIIDEGLFASKHEKRGKLPFDKNLGDYEYVRKRKCEIDKSKCHRKKRKIVPDDCDSDNCKKKCDQNIPNDENLLTSLIDFECKSKNPKEDCPALKITPEPIDRSFDDQYKPADPCCQEARKGLKRTEKDKRKKPKGVDKRKK